MKLLLALTAFLCASAQQLELVFMGDWGGQPSSPYSTTDERDTAKIMGEIVSTATTAAVGLGDNFYNDGVTNVNDPRFKETFDDVFTASSLSKLPFYFIAGNHDHHQNVTAQVARNGMGRWNYKDYWYSVQWNIPNTSPQMTVQLVLMDTVYACGGSDDLEYCNEMGIKEEDCKLQPTGPDDIIKANDQWTWIENELKSSTADYLLVGGHYPVWSIAEHGPTSCLVNQLRPMLIKYNVTSYLCGHDHTYEYLVEEQYPNLGYIVTGSAHTCDSSTAHKGDVPKNSLKYHGCESGGFTRVTFDKDEMKFYHYYGNGNKVVALQT